ncbi:hypothetical protein [Pararobbsia alpina]|uniref:Uncharacterized protein n=1 Tax=Pararobbsia alpina TaxID=621374 RepID=A0A6S7B0X0_9BURK|nr:hypothetical protein [Pararobbsia alpina]CAB3784303.1 hypothetical protein LMG28138_01782 [Pararobbsia alpina]
MRARYHSVISSDIAMKMRDVFGFLLCISAIPANAKPALLPNYVACQSQEALRQMGQAIRNHDDNGIRYLSRQCTLTTSLKGRPFSVIDSTLLGETRIRVYDGSAATELWTPSEAVEGR